MGLLLRGAGNAGLIPAVVTHDYDLWINLGQSNARGFPEDPWQTTPDSLPPGQFFDWNGTEFVEISGTPNRTTRAGLLGFVLGGSSGGYQNRLYPQLVGGRKLLLVSYTLGGSGIVPGISYGGGNWSDTHLSVAKVNVAAAIAAANAAGFNFRLRGVTWQQGEADSTALNDGSYTDPQTYADALDAIIDDLWSSYSSVYVPLSDHSAFFNVIANIGSYSTTVGLVRYPSDVTNRNYDIWDIHRRINEVNSHAKAVTLRGPWLGLRGLLHDNVHSTVAGYNDLADNAAHFMLNGTVLSPQSPPTSLSVTDRTRFNAVVGWTNNAATARKILYYRRKASDTEWELCGQGDSNIVITTIGLPDQTADYEVKISTWGDEGIFDSATLSIAKFATAAPVVPDAFFAASGVSSGSAEGIDIAAIIADLTSGGLITDLCNFVIFRSGYNADSGSVVYDIMGNANWTLNGTITRDSDHYACDGTTGNFSTDWALPGSRTPSVVLWHKQSSTEAFSFTLGRSQPPDSAAADGNQDRLTYQILADGTISTVGGQVTTSGRRFNQIPLPVSTSSGQVDGTVKSCMWTHRSRADQDGNLAIFQNGNATPAAIGNGGRIGTTHMYFPRFARIGRFINTYTPAKPSVLMLYARQLSGAEYAAIDAILADYL
jgi:hypothetical protein